MIQLSDTPPVPILDLRGVPIEKGSLVAYAVREGNTAEQRVGTVLGFAERKDSHYDYIVNPTTGKQEPVFEDYSTVARIEILHSSGWSGNTGNTSDIVLRHGRVVVIAP